MQLTGVKIGSQLNCADATFTNDGGDALSADGAEITGGTFLDEGLFTGAVRFLDAKIGGLDCAGATFTNEGGDALSADRAEFTDGVHFKYGV